MDHRRKLVIAAGALLVVAAVAEHPSADIRVLAHDAGDRSPRRVQAAVDVGLASVSVLVTWTARRLVE